MSGASITPPAAPPMTDLRTTLKRPKTESMEWLSAFHRAATGTVSQPGTSNSTESRSAPESGRTGSEVASAVGNTRTEHPVPQSETHQSHQEGIAAGPREVDPLDAVQSQVSIYLMLHRDADILIKSLDSDDHVDAWPVDEYYTVVVHSYSSSDWNALAQFIQIRRLGIRRQMNLVSDAPQVRSRTQPKLTKHCGAAKFCVKLLYVAGTIAVLTLGGALVWFVAGRVSAFLSWVSEVPGLFALAYYSMIEAAEAATMASIHTVASSFHRLGRAEIALRTGLKRNIKRRLLATAQSALVYLEDLRDSTAAAPLLGED